MGEITFAQSSSLSQSVTLMHTEFSQGIPKYFGIEDLDTYPQKNQIPDIVPEVVGEFGQFPSLCQITSNTSKRTINKLYLKMYSVFTFILTLFSL